MSNRDIYHRDFQLKPWWWEAYNPNAMELADVPRNADVAVIGAGYAGLACALELARHGRSCVVFDAEQPGFGGSTRNGGMVSGGRNVGKRYTRATAAERARLGALRRDAADGFDLVELSLLFILSAADILKILRPAPNHAKLYTRSSLISAWKL